MKNRLKVLLVIGVFLFAVTAAITAQAGPHGFSAMERGGLHGLAKQRIPQRPLYRDRQDTTHPDFHCHRYNKKRICHIHKGGNRLHRHFRLGRLKNYIWR